MQKNLSENCNCQDRQRLSAINKKAAFRGLVLGILILEKYRHSLVCVYGYADFSCSLVDVETGGSNSPMQFHTILIRCTRLPSMRSAL